MTEEWRPIPGFQGYDVSSLGRVRSWRGAGRRASSEPRVMSGKSNNGYREVLLSCAGKRRTLLVEQARQTRVALPLCVWR